jgi:hypothetical protein
MPAAQDANIAFVDGLDLFHGAREPIPALPEEARRSALPQDGGQRDGAQVAEITHVERLDMTPWCCAPFNSGTLAPTSVGTRGWGTKEESKSLVAAFRSAGPVTGVAAPSAGVKRRSSVRRKLRRLCGA